MHKDPPNAAYTQTLPNKETHHNNNRNSNVDHPYNQSENLPPHTIETHTK